MGKAYANRKSESERPLADFYGTPPILTKKLLEKESFKGDILEPACGEKAIVKVLRKSIDTKLIYFDLYKGENKQDFLTYNTPHNNIITNPPFSQFDEFVLHAKKIATNKIAMIGKLNFFGAYKRWETGVWDELKTIYCFNRQVDYRSPYREDDLFHVGNLVTGWFIWEKGYQGKVYFDYIDIQPWAKLGQIKD